MTELKQAITKGSSLVDHLRGLDSSSGDAVIIEQLVEAARVVADIEKLPKPFNIRVYNAEAMISWGDDWGANEVYKRTLPLALRAALEKVGG